MSLTLMEFQKMSSANTCVQWYNEVVMKERHLIKCEQTVTVQKKNDYKLRSVYSRVCVMF